MNIDKYCFKIEKTTNDLVKKMFGYPDVKVALLERGVIAKHISKVTGKDIRNIDYQTLEDNNLCYDYAKYTAIVKITDCFINAMTLRTFVNKELDSTKGETK